MLKLPGYLVALILLSSISCKQEGPQNAARERISINDDWRFMKYQSSDGSDSLIYDVRPEVTDTQDDKAADSKPTEAIEVSTNMAVLKPWILPTGNEFISDPSKKSVRPDGNPGGTLPAGAKRLR